MLSRSRYPVFYVVAMVVLLVVCLAIVCQVRSCARKMGIGRMGQIGRIVEGLTGAESLLAPEGGPTEPQKPSVVPPGNSAVPTASRRPVFGKSGDEGTEIRILPQRHEDTIGLRIRKDGSVQNIGGETLAVRVTRYGPPWVEWDPSAGVCVMGRVQSPFSSDESSDSPLGVGVNWRGYPIDFGVKGKFIYFRPGRVVQIGAPTLYATTAGPGVGADFRISGMEWIALDAGYFPMVRTAAVGVSVNWP